MLRTDGTSAAVVLTHTWPSAVLSACTSSVSGSSAVRSGAPDGRLRLPSAPSTQAARARCLLSSKMYSALFLHHLLSWSVSLWAHTWGCSFAVILVVWGGSAGGQDFTLPRAIGRPLAPVLNTFCFLLHIDLQHLNVVFEKAHFDAMGFCFPRRVSFSHCMILRNLCRHLYMADLKYVPGSLECSLGRSLRC